MRGMRLTFTRRTSTNQLDLLIKNIQEHPCMDFDERSLSRWCALHGGLSKVRYLSLTDAERERRASFLNSAAPYFRTTLEPCEAVDGRSVLREGGPVVDRVINSVTWHRMHKRRQRETHEGIYTAGAVGCALSHMREMLLASRRSGCTLVLESDALIRNPCPAWHRLATRVPVLPRHVDSVLLHTLSAREGNRTAHEGTHGELLNVDGPFFGMVAVLYTPTGARKLVDLLRHADSVIHSQIDATLGAMCARYGRRDAAANSPAGMGKDGPAEREATMRPELLCVVRTPHNVVRLTRAGLTSTSIQTFAIKTLLPSGNAFYLALMCLMLVLLVSVVVLSVYVHRLRRP